MINIINFKLIMGSSLHPVMPIFMGNWNTCSATKWRGAAAEFTYNPYLRNGWVIIDTGVKGSGGTPIIEFSTWDAAKSRDTIAFPNVMSYKFFLPKANYIWNAGYLSRSSIAPKEVWDADSFNYYSVLNKHNVSYLPGEIKLNYSKPIFLVAHQFSNLIATKTYLVELTSHRNLFNWLGVGSGFFKLLSLKNHTRLKLKFFKKIQSFRRDFMNFLVYDRAFISNFYVNCAGTGFSTFKNYFFGYILKNFSFKKFTNRVRAISDFSLPININCEFFTFREFLFKLNLVALLFLAAPQALGSKASVFERIIKFLVRQFVRLSVLYNFISKADLSRVLVGLETLFCVRFTILKNCSGLSLVSVARIISYSIFSYIKQFSSFSLCDVKLASSKSITTGYFRDLIAYKLNFLRYKVLFNKKDTLALFVGGGQVSTRSFFLNYLKIKRWHSRRKKKVFVFLKKREYNFKSHRAYDKLVSPGKLEVKCFLRSWKKVFGFFRLFFMRKQFFFMSFWSFNFFNFSVLPTRIINKRTFIRVVRLIHFFKKFFSFFKFYGFYFHLMRFSINSRNASLSSFAEMPFYLTNLYSFLWILYLKFWRLLCTFNSLCKKFFYIHWKSDLLHSVSSLPVIRNIVGALKKKKNKYTRFLLRKRVPRTCKPVSIFNKLALKTRSVLLTLLKSYSSYVKNSLLTRNLISVNAKPRHYMYFLLNIRKNFISLNNCIWLSKLGSLSSAGGQPYPYRDRFAAILPLSLSLTAKRNSTLEIFAGFKKKVVAWCNFLRKTGFALRSQGFLVLKRFWISLFFSKVQKFLYSAKRKFYLFRFIKNINKVRSVINSRKTSTLFALESRLRLKNLINSLRSVVIFSDDVFFFFTQLLFCKKSLMLIKHNFRVSGVFLASLSVFNFRVNTVYCDNNLRFFSIFFNSLTFDSVVRSSNIKFISNVANHGSPAIRQMTAARVNGEVGLATPINEHNPQTKGLQLYSSIFNMSGWTYISFFVNFVNFSLLGSFSVLKYNKFVDFIKLSRNSLGGNCIFTKKFIGTNFFSLEEQDFFFFSSGRSFKAQYTLGWLGPWDIIFSKYTSDSLSTSKINLMLDCVLTGFCGLTSAAFALNTLGGQFFSFMSVSNFLPIFMVWASNYFSLRSCVLLSYYADLHSQLYLMLSRACFVISPIFETLSEGLTLWLRFKMTNCVSENALFFYARRKVFFQFFLKESALLGSQVFQSKSAKTYSFFRNSAYSRLMFVLNLIRSPKSLNYTMKNLGIFFRAKVAYTQTNKYCNWLVSAWKLKGLASQYRRRLLSWLDIRKQRILSRGLTHFIGKHNPISKKVNPISKKVNPIILPLLVRKKNFVDNSFFPTPRYCSFFSNFSKVSLYKAKSRSLKQCIKPYGILPGQQRVFSFLKKKPTNFFVAVPRFRKLNSLIRVHGPFSLLKKRIRFEKSGKFVSTKTRQYSFLTRKYFKLWCLAKRRFYWKKKRKLGRKKKNFVILGGLCKRSVFILDSRKQIKLSIRLNYTFGRYFRELPFKYLNELRYFKRLRLLKINKKLSVVHALKGKYIRQFNKNLNKLYNFGVPHFSKINSRLAFIRTLRRQKLVNCAVRLKTKFCHRVNTKVKPVVSIFYRKKLISSVRFANFFMPRTIKFSSACFLRKFFKFYRRHSLFTRLHDKTFFGLGCAISKRAVFSACGSFLTRLSLTNYLCFLKIRKILYRRLGDKSLFVLSSRLRSRYTFGADLSGFSPFKQLRFFFLRAPLFARVLLKVKSLLVSLKLNSIKKKVNLVGNLKNSRSSCFFFVSKKYLVNFLSNLNRRLVGLFEKKTFDLFSKTYTFFFLRVRSIKKVFLEAHARRVGLLPKLIGAPTNRRDFKPNLTDIDQKIQTSLLKNAKKPSQIPSYFNRNNLDSMSLTHDFSNEIFKFTRIHAIKSIVYLTVRNLQSVVRNLRFQTKTWRDRRLVSGPKRIKRSKFIKKIKRVRCFYKIKKFLTKWKKKTKRAFIRSYMKLCLVRRFAKTSKIVKFLRFSRLLKRGHARTVGRLFRYFEIRKFLFRKFLFRSYANFKMLKTSICARFFRQMKFSFVFKFINFFFKRIFNFFSNFVVFNKLSFLGEGGFIFCLKQFAYKISVLPVNALCVVEHCSVVGLVNRVVGALVQFNGMLTDVRILRALKMQGTFSLTGFSFGFFRYFLDTSLPSFAYFQPLNILKIWTRVRKASKLVGYVHTLMLSRNSVYTKSKYRRYKSFSSAYRFFLLKKLKRARDSFFLLSRNRISVDSLLMFSRNNCRDFDWSNLEGVNLKSATKQLRVFLPVVKWFRSWYNKVREESFNDPFQRIVYNSSWFRRQAPTLSDTIKQFSGKLGEFFLRHILARVVSPLKFSNARSLALEDLRSNVRSKFLTYYVKTGVLNNTKYVNNQVLGKQSSEFNRGPLFSYLKQGLVPDKTVSWHCRYGKLTKSKRLLLRTLLDEKVVLRRQAGYAPTTLWL